MRNPKKLSETPVLDLLQPLPELDTERITGRFAAPFLTFVALIVITGNLSFLLVPLGFLLLNFVTILIHECGHLVAGWCVGFRFKAVRVDPFRVRIDSGKWKFRIRPRLFWGFALMSLDRVRRIRRRLIISVGGGPIASIFCGLVAVVAGEIGLARYDSAWPTFLYFLGAYSLFIGTMSLIPFRTRGFANDGMLLRSLLFRKSEGSQIVASYALAAVKRDGPFPPDYCLRWFRLAATPAGTLGGNYCADWLNYENAEDAGSAALFLERCLAQSAWMDDDSRDLLIAEAVVFTAWRRRDASKADTWFERIKCIERLHPIWLTRANIALLCARDQFEDANEELQRGLSLIRLQPKSRQRQRFEEAWITWQQEILQRVPVEVS